MARHWLVLAVATLWVLAYGTRAEEAERQGLSPARLHRPPQTRSKGRWGPSHLRLVTLFQRGLAWLRVQLAKARLWQCHWLAPEPWPEPPVPPQITYHAFI